MNKFGYYRALMSAGVAIISYQATAQDKGAIESQPHPENIVPPSSFILLDARPDREKKSFYFSSNLFSCESGVYNIGERGSYANMILKDRMGKLRNALILRYGDKLLKHSVSVERFRLLFNGNAENKSTAVGMAFWRWYHSTDHCPTHH